MVFILTIRKFVVLILKFIITSVTLLSMKNIEHSKIIDKLGGTVAASRIFKISPQAVSMMRRRGIPEYRIDYLKLLRPELFQNKNS